MQLYHRHETRSKRELKHSQTTTLHNTKHFVKFQFALWIKQTLIKTLEKEKHFEVI